MSSEFWVGLLLALVVPLIAVVYAGLKTRIDRIESAYKKEVADLRIDIRHRVENINLKLMDSLHKDNLVATDKMMEAMRVIFGLLEKRALDEVLAQKEAERRKQRG